MGIADLYRQFQCLTTPSSVEFHSGTVVAVDGYAFLHRGVATSAPVLLRVHDLNAMTLASKFKDSFLGPARKLTNQLLAANITPIIVFDGAKLPAKEYEEQRRSKERRKRLEEALKLLVQPGKTEEYKKLARTAVEVTPFMAREWALELKEKNVNFIVAPYEADSQMAYLSRSGAADVILSEDSDMLAYGVSRLWSKWDLLKGEFLEIDLVSIFSEIGPRRDPAVAEFRSVFSTFEVFFSFCVLSGNDFVERVPGLGPGRLKKYFEMSTKCRTSIRGSLDIWAQGPDCGFRDWNNEHITWQNQINQPNVEKLKYDTMNIDSPIISQVEKLEYDHSNIDSALEDTFEKSLNSSTDNNEFYGTISTYRINKRVVPRVYITVDVFLQIFRRICRILVLAETDGIKVPPETRPRCFLCLMALLFQTVLTLPSLRQKRLNNINKDEEDILIQVYEVERNMCFNKINKQNLALPRLAKSVDLMKQVGPFRDSECISLLGQSKVHPDYLISWEEASNLSSSRHATKEDTINSEENSNFIDDLSLSKNDNSKLINDIELDKTHKITDLKQNNVNSNSYDSDLKPILLNTNIVLQFGKRDFIKSEKKSQPNLDSSGITNNFNTKNELLNSNSTDIIFRNETLHSTEDLICKVEKTITSETFDDFILQHNINNTLDTTNFNNSISKEYDQDNNYESRLVKRCRSSLTDIKRQKYLNKSNLSDNCVSNSNSNLYLNKKPSFLPNLTSSMTEQLQVFKNITSQTPDVIKLSNESSFLNKLSSPIKNQIYLNHSIQSNDKMNSEDEIYNENELSIVFRDLFSSIKQESQVDIEEDINMSILNSCKNNFIHGDSMVLSNQFSIDYNDSKKKKFNDNQLDIINDIGYIGNYSYGCEKKFENQLDLNESEVLVNENKILTKNEILSRQHDEYSKKNQEQLSIPSGIRNISILNSANTESSKTSKLSFPAYIEPTNPFQNFMSPTSIINLDKILFTNVENELEYFNKEPNYTSKLEIVDNSKKQSYNNKENISREIKYSDNCQPSIVVYKLDSTQSLNKISSKNLSGNLKNSNVRLKELENAEKSDTKENLIRHKKNFIYDNQQEISNIDLPIIYNKLDFTDNKAELNNKDKAYLISSPNQIETYNFFDKLSSNLKMNGMDSSNSTKNIDSKSDTDKYNNTEKYHIASEQSLIMTKYIDERSNIHDSDILNHYLKSRESISDQINHGLNRFSETLGTSIQQRCQESNDSNIYDNSGITSPLTHYHLPDPLNSYLFEATQNHLNIQSDLQYQIHDEVEFTKYQEDKLNISNKVDYSTNDPRNLNNSEYQRYYNSIELFKQIIDKDKDGIISVLDLDSKDYDKTFLNDSLKENKLSIKIENKNYENEEQDLKLLFYDTYNPILDNNKSTDTYNIFSNIEFSNSNIYESELDQEILKHRSTRKKEIDEDNEFLLSLTSQKNL